MHTSFDPENLKMKTSNFLNILNVDKGVGELQDMDSFIFCRTLLNCLLTSEMTFSLSESSPRILDERELCPAGAV